MQIKTTNAQMIITKQLELCLIMVFTTLPKYFEGQIFQF